MIEEPIGKYLSITRRAHAALLDKLLKPYGISHGQIFLLIALYEEEGISQHNLCEIYNLDKAGVGRSLNKLREKGYIRKEIDEVDKRRKKLYLTEKADKFKDKLFNILDTVEKQVRSDLTEEEIKEIIHVFAEE